MHLIWISLTYAQPAVELSEEDQAVEEAGLEPVGQSASPLFAGFWEKSILEGREEDRLILGGYVETEYEDDLEGAASFDAHRAILFLYTRIHPRVSFATEIEWEHGGTPRKEDGSYEVGEVLLEFAAADFKVADWLNLRSGVVLVPMGSYNLRHDAPAQDLTTRPLVDTYIAPTTWFETGGGLFGQIPVGDRQRLDYEIYAINGLDQKIYDGSGTRSAKGSLAEDNNWNKATVGRISYRPTGGLELGLSGYRGAYDPDSERFIRMGALDLTGRMRWLEVQGEVMGALTDGGTDEGWAEATGAPIPEALYGWYTQVNAHFMPGFLARAMPDDLGAAHFTAVARYGEIDTDLDQVSAGDRSQLIAGLNFRPIEAFVLKNELLLDSDGSSGELNRPGPGWEPELGYVASVALMF